MRTHQQLMHGDPDAAGAENLLKTESAAVGADGSLHMIKEVVEGGDVEKTSVNLRLMEESGLLPRDARDARDALTVDIIRQTVMGMKAMEARGLVHNDMKGANLMLTQNGTVKIMDFGESRISDAQGHAPSAASSNFGTTGA